MVPSDPWERLLVSGVARDLQQIRLDFLSEAKGKDIHAHVDSWLAAKEKRVDQFRALVKRARDATAPNTAMLAELTGQARGLQRKKIPGNPGLRLGGGHILSNTSGHPKDPQ